MSKRQPQHIEAAKRRLVHLAGLAEKTAETERRILAAAEERLAAVCADLDKLRPRALTDQDAGEQYQALTLERGQLETVIARAREVLGS
ncbi:hypothetical protein [Azospirillum sp.]|uniref:hypothetical protein n=1 Tax=Azospirillum sp. TaxID=34012 RepID=UPI003D72C0FC